ncbi:hypothetical protein AtNW77_Chr5g0130171 [Arabidopsis thaliana]|uniref:Uncharacterized protein n=1 Tax=Arabidopsis suecica TaxID=45249 RepID=A0A8T2DX11_ARASU|nr:hypothetical protein ISN44_As05g040300 [Arabidopsis suecica]
MASTKADQFLELVAELDRVNTSTNVDKDQVKDLEKRLIPYVEKNEDVITKYRKVFIRLKMEKIQDMIKRIDIDNMLNPASSSQKISRSMDRKNW